MSNKVKILRYIAMNGPQSMDDLVTRQTNPTGRITDQTRGAFKQYIYQLKMNGDLDQQNGGKYSLTPKAESYLRAVGQLPTSDPGDDDRLDVCPDCQKTVNLEKHQCPKADPLGLDDDDEEEVDIRTMKKPPAEDPEDPEPKYRPSTDPPPMTIEKLTQQINEQKSDFDDRPVGSGVFIEFDELDLEIDCMRSLMLIMTRFDREGLDHRQRRRITEWFSDRFSS